MRGAGTSKASGGGGSAGGGETEGGEVSERGSKVEAGTGANVAVEIVGVAGAFLKGRFKMSRRRSISIFISATLLIGRNMLFGRVTAPRRC